MTMEHKNLAGLSREELVAEVVAMGEKPFRSKQLWHWIYHRGETEFDRMTTLAQPLRTALAETYVVKRPLVSNSPPCVPLAAIRWPSIKKILSAFLTVDNLFLKF